MKTDSKADMKTRSLAATNRVAPKQQHNWDWRAAGNFICGGAGGGLLLFAALASLAGADTRLAMLFGMALIGTGLTCVWFEIGRPWRALNVFRHFSTSWMTREAWVAPALFITGVLAVWSGNTVLVALAGALGVLFAYSQARILGADKGIPAWRHPRCRPLIFATGLAEGVGFLALTAPLLPANVRAGVGVGLALMLAIRLLKWNSYRAGLQTDGAPSGTLAVFAGLDGGFRRFGHILPAILALVAALAATSIGATASAGLLIVAGLLAVGAGWTFKFTLVRRAAFTQGFALKHLPVRGRGTAGPAVKPGWGGAA